MDFTDILQNIAIFTLCVSLVWNLKELHGRPKAALKDYMEHEVVIKPSRTYDNFYGQAVCSCGWQGGKYSALWNTRKQLRQGNKHLNRVHREAGIR